MRHMSLDINNAAVSVQRLKREKIRQRLNGKPNALLKKTESALTFEKPFCRKESQHKLHIKSISKLSIEMEDFINQNALTGKRKSSAKAHKKKRIPSAIPKGIKTEVGTQKSDQMRAQFILSLKEHLVMKKKSEDNDKEILTQNTTKRMRTHLKRPGTAFAVPENSWMKNSNPKPVVLMSHMQIKNSKSKPCLSTLILKRNPRDLSFPRKKSSGVDIQSIYTAKRPDRSLNSNNTSINASSKNIRAPPLLCRKEFKDKRTDHKKDILQNLNFVSKAPIFSKKPPIMPKKSFKKLPLQKVGTKFKKKKTLKAGRPGKENDFMQSNLNESATAKTLHCRSRIELVKMKTDQGSDEEDNLYHKRLKSRY
ncbi:unnamed protein product [Moneuplotes crassus]|uniref:Uncharacterized protein n=1 Tax=Euplotes crassus TaxID=5936 RepID=A0AAD1UJQ1_EUPCR|nr:unnamed protein product [Moneuplotes crassus]